MCREGRRINTRVNVSKQMTNGEEGERDRGGGAFVHNLENEKKRKQQNHGEYSQKCRKDSKKQNENEAANTMDNRWSRENKNLRISRSMHVRNRRQWSLKNQVRILQLQ